MDEALPFIASKLVLFSCLIHEVILTGPPYKCITSNSRYEIALYVLGSYSEISRS